MTLTAYGKSQNEITGPQKQCQLKSQSTDAVTQGSTPIYWKYCLAPHLDNIAPERQKSMTIRHKNKPI